MGNWGELEFNEGLMSNKKNNFRWPLLLINALIFPLHWKNDADLLMVDFTIPALEGILKI